MMASRGRPEHQGPPEFVYSETEARKYSLNSRIIEVQQHLSERAIEILSLPEDVPCMILDIGCGSGLSGECLTEANHVWIGIDISHHMLEVASDREVEGGLILGDMGSGMPFRPGMFDGVISISALQWLCNADKESHNPAKRLFKFFTTLYSSMSRGARAVFQFYPENERQINLILQQSIKAGFEGGLVMDYPNSTKAKKIYLFLYTGGAPQDIPKGLEKEDMGETEQVNFTRKRLRFKDMKGKSAKKSTDWIMEKKEKRKKQGKAVKQDSKFTGRKRRVRF